MVLDSRALAAQVAAKFNRCAVTGAAGFIGSHIVEALLPTGIDIVAVDDLSAGKLENMASFRGASNFRFERADVSDRSALRKAFDGADLIFHNAASKKNICLTDPPRDLMVNGLGAFHVFDIAREIGAKKVVHASTGSVYGEPTVFPQTEDHPLDPVSYYGVSKLAGERYGLAFHKLYGLDVTVLRYFHVYGPRQDWDDQFGGVVSIFLRRALSGKNLVVHSDGLQERSFTSVYDVARANLLTALSPQAAGEAYNCASGIKIKIKDLAEWVLSRVEGGDRLTVEHANELPGDIRRFEVSNEKLRSLGMTFETDVWAGLAPTLDWMTTKLREESQQ